MLKEWDFSPGMLNPTDGWLIHALISELNQAAPVRVLEIGVWRGSWLFLAARASGVNQAVGIDPYPGIPNVRADFLNRVQALGLGGKVSLVSSPAEFEATAEGKTAKFDIMHVDGEHTQRAADIDLQFCTRHLSDHGLIIMDDYNNLYYPGVAAAMSEFLRDRQYAVFLLTTSQAYLCRASHYEKWRAKTMALLRSTPLIWGEYIGDRGSGATGNEPRPTLPAIHGHSPLLCLDAINDRILLSGVSWPVRERVRYFVRRWLPPALREWLRPPMNLRTMPPPPAQPLTEPSPSAAKR